MNVNKTIYGDKPYFYAKKLNEKIISRGVSTYLLGNKTKGEKYPFDDVFAKWSWDGACLKVENDRYGFYPLYYYCVNNEIAVSPSILKLIDIGAPREIDYTALSVFLRLGWFIGDDTPFKYIKAIPPNAEFSWQDGTLKVHGSYTCGKMEKHLSFDEAVETFIDLFHQAMKRRLPKDEDFILPLSGGRDSRHILFELIAQRYRPRLCVTSNLFPPGTREDIRIAKILADEFKVEHHAIDELGPYFHSVEKRIMGTDFCSDELDEMPIIADYLKQNTDMIYDGIAGSIFSSGFGLSARKVALYKDRDYWQLADEMLDGSYINQSFNEPCLEKLLSKECYRQMNGNIARQHLILELEKHVDTANPLSQFLFWNRTRREIALSPYVILSKIPNVYTPFLDHDLYDFLSSLDASYFLDKTFHTAAIQRAFPEYADIPFEDKTVKNPNTQSVRKQYVGSLLSLLLRKHGYAKQCMRLSYVIPRLVRFMIKGDNWWICPPFIQYLVKLSECVDFDHKGNMTEDTNVKENTDECNRI